MPSVTTRPGRCRQCHGKAARVAAAIALGAMSAGCGPQPPMPPLPAQAGVVFSASVAANDDGYAIEYRVTNTSQSPVVITDGLPQRDSTNYPDVDPERFYVDRRGTNVVQISRQPLAPPEADSPNYVLLGTRLKPGEASRGSGRVTLPLQHDTPYDEPREIPTDRPFIIHVCLGVVDEASIDADLQALAQPDNPVIAHDHVARIVCDEASMP